MRAKGTKEKKPPSIYFGGAAWGSAFYVGVHRAMVERWGPNFMEEMIVCGDSAGVFWALGISLKKSPDELERIYLSQVVQARKEGVWFGKSFDYLDESMRILLDDPDAFRRLEGKFSTATTEFPFKHKRYWSWKSNDDLTSCMHGSLHIPIYTSCHKRHFNGRSVIDGAYSMSGNDLPHQNDTLFIGIDPHADITRTLTLAQMVYPPNDAQYQEFVRDGYEEMMKWDGTMKPKVGFRFPNYQALLIFWPLKVLAKLIRIIYLLLTPLLTVFTIRGEAPVCH